MADLTAARDALPLRRPSRSPMAIIGACAFVVLLEGYDQSVYGAVLPVLVKDPSWHMTKVQAGYVGSAAYAGMMVGALGASWLATRTSRRMVLLGCLLAFGVFGTACYWTHSPMSLGTLRFLTGLGLGGVLPVTSTLTFSRVPPGRRMLIYSLMFATIPFGGLITALVGKSIIPEHGPMIMFLLPGPFVVVALLLTASLIPTGPAAPVTRDGEIATESVFSTGWRAVTTLLVLATLLGLLLWYGLLTWLPGIMSEAGYNLGSALTFQVLLLAGGVIGSVLIAPCYDRFSGHYGVIAAIYLLGAVALFLCIGSPAKAPLLALIFVAGAVAQGGLITLNGLVDRTYPESMRSTALGTTLGFGRIGAIIAPSVIGHLVGRSASASFVFFAIAAALASLLVAVAAHAIRRRGLALTPA